MLHLLQFYFSWLVIYFVSLLLFSGEVEWADYRLLLVTCVMCLSCYLLVACLRWKRIICTCLPPFHFSSGTCLTASLCTLSSQLTINDNVICLFIWLDGEREDKKRNIFGNGLWLSSSGKKIKESFVLCKEKNMLPLLRIWGNARFYLLDFSDVIVCPSGLLFNF